MPKFQSLVPSPQLILASRSPRRRELLAEADYNFEVMPPDEDVECGVCSESGPAGLVADLAYRKAAAIVRHLTSLSQNRRGLAHFAESSEQNVPVPLSADGSGKGSKASLPDREGLGEGVILAADTVAECDGFVLGKPADEPAARAMLQQLSGREHRVLTGLCLWPLRNSQPLVRVAVTRLRMDPLTDTQLNEYLNSGAWEGKAGAFGYQDRLGWVHVVEGSESNVVGLPMELLAEMLAELNQVGDDPPLAV